MALHQYHHCRITAAWRRDVSRIRCLNRTAAIFSFVTTDDASQSSHVLWTARKLACRHPSPPLSPFLSLVCGAKQPSREGSLCKAFDACPRSHYTPPPSVLPASATPTAPSLPTSSHTNTTLLSRISPSLPHAATMTRKVVYSTGLLLTVACEFGKKNVLQSGNS
jgi:hypothetical protein